MTLTNLPPVGVKARLKVLVATAETQGRRANDYCWTEEGELASWPLTECSSEPVDGACGCRRGLGGLQSHRATTTVKVAEIESTIDEFVGQQRESYLRAGYPEVLVNSIVRRYSFELLLEAERHEVGTILERRGSELKIREGASVAASQEQMLVEAVAEKRREEAEDGR
jgi:hypothetical protein